jgi:hypothetical protein
VIPPLVAAGVEDAVSVEMDAAALAAYLDRVYFDLAGGHGQLLP